MSYTPLHNIVLSGTPETTGDLVVGDDLQVVDSLRLGADDAIGWVTLRRDDDGVNGWIEANDAIRYGNTPVHGDELVNRDYVDSVATGLDLKESVRVASQADVTIASPGVAIDGVTLATGDRVLLKAQAAGEENGIYVFDTDVTPMVRAADADDNDKVNAGMFVFVEEGTNADQGWVLTTNNPIDLDVDALTFSQFSNAVIVSTLDSLTDVDVTGAVENATLVFDGSDWYDSENILLDDANRTINLGSASLVDDADELVITAVDALTLDGGTGNINLNSTSDVIANVADRIGLYADNGVDPLVQIEMNADLGIDIYGLAVFNTGIVQTNGAGIDMQAGALSFRYYLNATDLAVKSKVDGDAEDRYQMSVDGKMLWGDGTNAGDTNLYRSDADLLKTDDSLEVAGSLFVAGVGELRESASFAGELEIAHNGLYMSGADMGIDNGGTIQVYSERGVSDRMSTLMDDGLTFEDTDGEASVSFYNSDQSLRLSADGLVRVQSPLEVEQGLRFSAVNTYSAAQTLDAGSDHIVLVDLTTAGAPVTITLPAAPVAGMIFQIKDMSGLAETHNITIAGNGKNIDGAADAVMGVDYQSSTVIYDAAADAWFLI